MTAAIQSSAMLTAPPTRRADRRAARDELRRIKAALEPPRPTTADLVRRYDAIALEQMGDGSVSDDVRRRRGRTRAHGCVTFSARARRCAERRPNASAHEPSGWQRRSSAGPPRRRGGWHGGGAGERRRASRAVQVRTARGRPRQRVSLFGVVPDEVRIIPLADGESGYVQGFCEGPPAKPSVAAVVLAAGVRDQHGTRGDGGDEEELARLVPDEGDRERILDIAAQVMRHPSFLRVRNALWRRLQHRDVLYRDEIARIASSVSTIPDADLPSGEPRVGTAASAASGRCMSDKGLRTRRVGGLRPPNGGPLILEVAYHK
jgi:hypothetical protein